MKSFKTKDKSLYVLLIKNYLIFSLVMVVLMVLIYFLEGYTEEKIIQSPRRDRPIGGLQLLEDGEYEKLSMKKLLGTSGYFEILDADNMLIYTDYDLESEAYTEGEIACILEYNAPEMYTVSEYQTAEGKTQTLLTKRRYERDTGYQEEEAYFLLDEELNVIFSNVSDSDEKTQFTRRELRFLTMQGNTGYGICKYEFQDKYGRDCTLIMHIKKMDRQRYQRLVSVWKVFLPVYIATYLVITIAFALHMHRKVKEPLDMLNRGILDFAKGSLNKEINYKGPREFEVMFDSFNVMAKQLRESEESKEHLIREKQRMLADISHDLKTPITVIQGYAQAVCDGLADEQTKKQYLDTIFQKTENLTEMINNFYDYSKLEHPEFALVKKKGDLAEFLREYLASKYDEIDLAGFLIEVEIPEEVVEYSFDEVQLKRVFDNIISNALKHNPEKTVIYVTLQQTEKNIRIEIGDNGIGIPKEIQAGLFDPFVVGDDSRHNRQGSGLGLAVAGKIVELHGGALFLEKAGNPIISTLFVIRLMR